MATVTTPGREYRLTPRYDMRALMYAVLALTTAFVVGLGVGAVIEGDGGEPSQAGSVASRSADGPQVLPHAEALAVNRDAARAGIPDEAMSGLIVRDPVEAAIPNVGVYGQTLDAQIGAIQQWVTPFSPELARAIGRRPEALPTPLQAQADRLTELAASHAERVAEPTEIWEKRQQAEASQRPAPAAPVTERPHGMQ